MFKGKFEVKYFVEEVTFEKKVKKTIHTALFSQEINSIEEAENLLEAKGIISEHLYFSDLGFLLDWRILNIKYRSECDLAAERVLKWSIWEKREKERGKLFKEKPIEHSQGWLNPSGLFYSIYGFALHNKVAYEILEQIYGQAEKYESKFKLGDSASDVLERDGWIRILNWKNITGGIKILNGKQFFKPTSKQLDFLIRFCYQYNVDYDKIIQQW